MAKKKKIDGSGVAAIYARYSSHVQRDCSIEQQLDACRAKAKDLDLVVVSEYCDRGISGKTDDRPEFQRMLKDADKGKFQYLIAWKSNRLGRNMLNAMVNESRLQDAGVKCLYAEEDFDDNAAGRFALRSMMNVNQFYIENMAEDIQRGLRDSAKEGKALGAIPYGYKKSADGKYEINEDEAAIVREIYRRVANGEMVADIAHDLNKRGIKKRYAKKYSEWGKSSFQHLLHNEKYIGTYKYMDIEIPGGVPRIIDDDLYYRVQEVTTTKGNPYNNRRRTANGLYLLTGKIFCGKCGSPMVGLSGTGKSGRLFFYYVCQGKRVKHACDKQNIQREIIEREVAAAIKQFILVDETIDWIADQAVEFSRKAVAESDLSALESQLADTDRSINNLMKAIEAGIITDATKARMKELEAQKLTLKGKIAEEKSNVTELTKEDIVAGLSMFKDGDVTDPNYQMKLFDTFLRAVYVYDDNLKIVFSFSGDGNTVTLPLENDLAENKDSDSPGDKCSYKVPLGLLNTSYTNTPQITFQSGFFILYVPSPEALLED